MRLKWNAAHFSSILLILLASVSSQAQVISGVEWAGADRIGAEELSSGSLLKRGAVLTDGLLQLEMARVDSVYFSRGYLAVELGIGIEPSGDAVAVRMTLYEGDRATIGEVTVTGGTDDEKEGLIESLGLASGTGFDPLGMGRRMEKYLDLKVESGYPFAQVWLTGFSFDDQRNSVDLVISQYSGERASVSDVIFEGIAGTDSSFALRMSRLQKGGRYSERDLERCYEYLSGSGVFKSVERARVIMREAGAVDIVVPVVEKNNSNSFLGAFGFYQEDSGDYKLNGSLNLDLRNIAGKGRDINLDWLNDGQKYSDTKLVFREPDLISI